jgi:hypothetical protein
MKLVDICLRKSLHNLERVAERDLEHEAESFIARSNTWPGTRMSTLRRRRRGRGTKCRQCRATMGCASYLRRCCSGRSRRRA